MGSVGLNIGLRALLTSQTALDTVGHNISNANTPGYSRQSLKISTASPLQIRGLQVGTGVQADSITRTVDNLLTRRIIAQASSVSRLDALLVGMQNVEALLGEPGGFGIGERMSELFGSFADLSTDAADTVFRTGVTQAATSLTSQFHQLATEIETMGSDTFDRVESFVSKVNTHAQQIVDLNREIAKIEAGGNEASDLRDQRDLALEELAKEVDATYHEDPNGSMRVLIGGQLLVGHNTFNPMRAEFNDGEIALYVKGGTQPLEAGGGEIGGLVSFAHGFLPGLTGEFDTLARSLILEANRRHSVGIPPDGGFQSLSGTYSVMDSDGDGQLTDELLSDAGLPFDLSEGDLYVNIVSEATGAVRTSVISVDPTRTTIGDLLQQFDEIDGISASLDSQGRLSLTADSGTRFDFARRLNPHPDGSETFGSGRASHGSSLQGPYTLNSGTTLQLTGPVGPITVTFDASQFVDMSEATADEVAAAINSEPALQQNLLRAVAVGDRVYLQSIGEGSSESFTIDGGTAAAALGFAAGTNVQGHDTSVAVEVSGAYTGDANQDLVFRALSDGVIGTTAGLAVAVETADGHRLATLDVGEGYLPGTKLEVGDGIFVSLSYGTLSASDGDAFTEHLVADSDTADLLVAFGLNSFFTGTDAQTIELRADIALDPSAIAVSASGAEGDNGILLDLMDLQTEDVQFLDGTFGEYYGTVIGQIGFDVGSAENSLEVEETLQETLVSRRDQTSGVNIDEELVNMIQFEQSYGAAAQFIQVVNSLNDEVLNLL